MKQAGFEIPKETVPPIKVAPILALYEKAEPTHFPEINRPNNVILLVIQHYFNKFLIRLL